MKNQSNEKENLFRKNKEGRKVIGPNDVLSTEMLREYARAMHKAQKEGKRAPRSAAESIPFKSIDESGLFQASFSIEGDREPIPVSFADS